MWIHGGGLVSGSKEQVANYCKILASKGYLVAAIDYTIAPEAKFPGPIRQAGAALDYLISHERQLGIDTSLVVIAGDSGGSMIAAQVANINSNPGYAALIGVHPITHPGMIKGLVLFCGIYDIQKINMDGPFGFFMRTVTWSYFGTKEWSKDRYAMTASVNQYITHSFPPSFISAGNKDPLLAQSLAFSNTLSKAGVPIDTLFFSADRQPPLEHEYQFSLDDNAGLLALERSLAFLSKLKMNNKIPPASPIN